MQLVVVAFLAVWLFRQKSTDGWDNLLKIAMVGCVLLALNEESCTPVKQSEDPAGQKRGLVGPTERIDKPTPVVVYPGRAPK